MKTNITYTAPVTALLLTTAALQAGSFQGLTSGVFEDPEGPGVPDHVSGIGTATLMWGAPESSVLHFDGTFFANHRPMPFRVGELTYANGASAPENELNIVGLGVTVTLIEPETSEEVFALSLKTGPDFI